MKRKCPRCGKKRNTEYEFISKDSKQCVFCNDEDRKLKNE